ncbi:hypothetical protein DPMN_053843 [Dreissena polymorpha]|uniref:Uncharacterized protein n=1 Tax=Dreissena polymorpha TaxID=45954 RepID=A0A9D4CNU6_DREPO|nr:hypothetical protein DPMN_053843 [Dreissena polymorpha]
MSFISYSIFSGRIDTWWAGNTYSLQVSRLHIPSFINYSKFSGRIDTWWAGNAYSLQSLDTPVFLTGLTRGGQIDGGIDRQTHERMADIYTYLLSKYEYGI